MERRNDGTETCDRGNEGEQTCDMIGCTYNMSIYLGKKSQNPTRMIYTCDSENQ
jgi:hypothetical protein